MKGPIYVFKDNWEIWVMNRVWVQEQEQREQLRDTRGNMGERKWLSQESNQQIVGDGQVPGREGRAAETSRWAGCG